MSFIRLYISGRSLPCYQLSSQLEETPILIPYLTVRRTLASQLRPALDAWAQRARLSSHLHRRCICISNPRFSKSQCPTLPRIHTCRALPSKFVPCPQCFCVPIQQLFRTGPPPLPLIACLPTFNYFTRSPLFPFLRSSSASLGCSPSPPTLPYALPSLLVFRLPLTQLPQIGLTQAEPHHHGLGRALNPAPTPASKASEARPAFDPANAERPSPLSHPSHLTRSTHSVAYKPPLCLPVSSTASFVRRSDPSRYQAASPCSPARAGYKYRF